MVIIDCAYLGGAFQSKDTPEVCNFVLGACAIQAGAIFQSHTFSHAAPGPNFNCAPSEGPKLTRPIIDMGMSLAV